MSTHVLETEKGLMGLDLPLQCPICQSPVDADDFRAGNAFLMTGTLCDVAAHCHHFFNKAGDKYRATDDYDRNVRAMGIAYAKANDLGGAA